MCKSAGTSLWHFYSSAVFLFFFLIIVSKVILSVRMHVLILMAVVYGGGEEEIMFWPLHRTYLKNTETDQLIIISSPSKRQAAGFFGNIFEGVSRPDILLHIHQGCLDLSRSMSFCSVLVSLTKELWLLHFYAKYDFEKFLLRTNSTGNHFFVTA